MAGRPPACSRCSSRPARALHRVDLVLQPSLLAARCRRLAVWASTSSSSSCAARPLAVGDRGQLGQRRAPMPQLGQRGVGRLQVEQAQLRGGLVGGAFTARSARFSCDGACSVHGSVTLARDSNLHRSAELGPQPRRPPRPATAPRWPSARRRPEPCPPPRSVTASSVRWCLRSEVRYTSAPARARVGGVVPPDPPHTATVRTGPLRVTGARTPQAVGGSAARDVRGELAQRHRPGQLARPGRCPRRLGIGACGSRSNAGSSYGCAARSARDDRARACRAARPSPPASRHRLDPRRRADRRVRARPGPERADALDGPGAPVVVADAPAPAAASASISAVGVSPRHEDDELVQRLVGLARRAARRRAGRAVRRARRTRRDAPTSALVCATKCAMPPRIIPCTSAPFGSSRGYAVHAGQQQRMVGEQQLGAGRAGLGDGRAAPRRRRAVCGRPARPDRRTPARPRPRAPAQAGSYHSSSAAIRSASRTTPANLPTHADVRPRYRCVPEMRHCATREEAGAWCSSTAAGLLFLALWIFCIIDVITTPEDGAQPAEVRLAVHRHPALDLGSIAWLDRRAARGRGAARRCRCGPSGRHASAARRAAARTRTTTRNSWPGCGPAPRSSDAAPAPRTTHPKPPDAAPQLR